jgi:hypothetical protein
MSYLNNPRHWLDRAEETRAKAEKLWNEEARQRMLRIAVEYDRLASQAAERVQSDEALAANGVQWCSASAFTTLRPANQVGRRLIARYPRDTD